MKENRASLSIDEEGAIWHPHSLASDEVSVEECSLASGHCSVVLDMVFTYDGDQAEHQCGGYSAYSRPHGESPICYTTA